MIQFILLSTAFLCSISSFAQDNVCPAAIQCGSFEGLGQEVGQSSTYSEKMTVIGLGSLTAQVTVIYTINGQTEEIFNGTLNFDSAGNLEVIAQGLKVGSGSCLSQLCQISFGPYVNNNGSVGVNSHIIRFDSARVEHSWSYSGSFGYSGYMNAILNKVK